MSIDFDQAFRSAVADPAALKTIATIDEHGVPHLEENNSIHLNGDDRLVLLELNEYSRTNRNLVRSIWFDKKIAIHLRSKGRSFEVVASPYKVVIAGPVFEGYYRAQQEKGGDIALSTVWLIDAESVTEETAPLRFAREAAGRLPVLHLDRLARSPSLPA